MTRAIEGQSRVFISYAREDTGVAIELANELQAAGIEVWIDQRHIAPGKRWDAAVQQALKDCQRMLVVLTPSSVQSENVLDEVSYALSEGDLIVPVIAQACEVPFRLQRLQWVDLTKDRERAFELLCARLAASADRLSSLGPKVIATPRSDAPHRSRLRPALMVAAACVFAGGVWLSRPLWPPTSIDRPASPPPLEPASAATVWPPTKGLDSLDLFYAEDSGAARELRTRGLWDVTAASFADALAQPGISDMQRRHWQAGLELARGRIAAFEGKPAEAEALLRKALELRPHWSLAHLLLANVLQREKRYEEALTQATQAELHDGKLWQAVVTVGSIRAALGQAQEAIVELQRAQRLAPNASDVLSALALAYHFAGTHDADAAALAARALERDPDLVAPHIVLIEIALEKNQPTVAFLQSDKLIAYAGHSVAAWLARGDAAQASRQRKEARMAWQEALRLRALYGDQAAPAARLDEIAAALDRGREPPLRIKKVGAIATNDDLPPQRRTAPAGTRASDATVELRSGQGGDDPLGSLDDI